MLQLTKNHGGGHWAPAAKKRKIEKVFRELEIANKLKNA